MKQFKNTIRSLRRFRLRTKTLKCCAAIFALIALALILITNAHVDLFSRNNYITGFSVREIADDGETLCLTGGDDESLTISRTQYGSDLYFRLKKLVQKGGYIRAFILENEAAEIRYEGSRIYKNETLDMSLEMDMFRMLLMAVLFCLGVCGAFMLGVSVRNYRRRTRKNKK